MPLQVGHDSRLRLSHSIVQMLPKARPIVCLTVVLTLPLNILFAQKLRLPPQLRLGQTLIYQLDFTGSRTTKTDSHVTLAQVSPSSEVRASCLLQVMVVEANGSEFRLRTAISDRPVAAAPGTPVPEDSHHAAPDRVVEVQLAHDGTASNITGFDKLSVAQQLAWSSWLARFTSAMTFPDSGLRPGEKWQRSEPETGGSPLAKLVWVKKYEYVRDESCSPGASSPTERCAVVLVQAHLRQQSPAGKATPEDFKMRGLATGGTATGTNETILYLSRNTGLLVRSTEDAQQAMDVTIALADGSNSVHYSISAKSRSQTQLIPDIPNDVR